MRLSALRAWPVASLLRRIGWLRPPVRRRRWRRAAALLVPATLVLVAGIAAAIVPARYREFAIAETLTGGKAAAAPPLMRRYGCTGCHTIPGIPGADGKVGPALDQLQQRVYIGGHIRNSSDNLVRWLVEPLALSPASAMPATGLSEAEARDIAAWLYAH